MIIEKKPGIYIILCIPTQKVYIGQSLSIKSRIQGHRCVLRQGKHKNTYLQNAYSKYGIDMFTFRPLEYPEDTSPENLTAREQYWMDQFDSMNPVKGFNLKEAGDAGKPAPEVVAKLTGRKRSDEAKVRMSEAQKRLYESGYINPSKGRRATEETRKKMSEAQKNKDYSFITEEYKKNMSEKNKGRKHTEEVIERMKEVQGNRSEETRAKIKDNMLILHALRKARKETNPEVDYWAPLIDFPTGSY